MKMQLFIWKIGQSLLLPTQKQKKSGFWNTLRFIQQVQVPNKTDLIDPNKFPVFHSGRGGQYTYHGPGQRVAYVMLDLRKRGRDVSAFVRNLEQWIINTLLVFDITAERRSGRVGVWVIQENGTEEKIAAIGVRLKKWISFHGISINLNPDLSHFEGIVPCGIQDFGVTSLHKAWKENNYGRIRRGIKIQF